MTEDMYLRIRQVSARTGLSRATIYNMMQRGTFPMKTALGVRAVGWLESEITHWMVGRKAVVKTGRESSPGSGTKLERPGRVNIAVSPGRKQPERSKQLALAVPTTGVSLLDGWEDDSPALTKDEIEKSRAKRLVANRKPTVPSTNSSRTTKSISINPAGRLDDLVKTRSLALKAKTR